MNNIWVRLTLAFTSVALVAVGSVGLLVNRAVRGQFNLYVSRGGRVRAAMVAPLFANYYIRNGSWRGVERLMARWKGLGMKCMGGGRMIEWTGERLILVDEGGKLMADSEGEATGRILPPDVVAEGAPILVGGRRVGTLLVVSGRGGLEGKFLDRVNRSLIWAGLTAGGLAILLGSLLSWWIASPLRQLRRAAVAIARGELERRVKVGGDGEVGELGRAFNEMAEALQRNEELRRNMLADVAHELRTPLSVIRGDLEAILDGVYRADLQHISSIYEETLLLQRLVEDLRELSLAEAGQLPLEMEELDIGELVQGVVETVRATAQARGVSLEVEVEQPIPVLGDPHRLRQVLLNLLNNSLQYTPSGGEVKLRTWQKDGRAMVEVRDTGLGIPPEHLPHIFERFYRGLRSRPGSGIGLAIAKHLIEAHGGKIWASSPGSGSGSTFAFSLPLVYLREFSPSSIL